MIMDIMRIVTPIDPRQYVVSWKTIMLTCITKEYGSAMRCTRNVCVLDYSRTHLKGVREDTRCQDHGITLW